MEESLAILGRRKECVTDESFVHQVRLQLISREIETVRHPTMPPHFYFKALQARLDGVKSTISPELLEYGEYLAVNQPNLPMINLLEYYLSDTCTSLN